MRIPEFVQAVLTEFENQTGPFSEAEVYDALRNARKAQGDLSEEAFEGFRAEAVAFFFYERRDRDSPWGTFFAPSFTGKRPDGTEVRNPDIKELNADVVHHWEERAKTAKNPVLRARYADLVWDLQQAITSQRPKVEYARIAIDSYLEATEKRFYTMEVCGIQWTERALDLALTIGDNERVKQVVDFMFDFYDRIATPQHIGTWLFLFDNLYDRKDLITAEQEARIIANLEEMLAKVSNDKDEGFFTPFGAEAAAERLVSHYRRKSGPQNVERVIRTYGRAFENAALEASPILATAWLQPVFERYQQAGMQADAERVQLLSLEKARNVESDMKQISAEVEIPHEELEKYLDWLTEGNLNAVLRRIAIRFIPDVDDVQKFLLKTAEEAPLQALFSVVKIDDGQIVATAGSVQDDQEGRLVMQLAENIQISQIFLVEGLQRLRDRYRPTVEQYLGFLYQSPVFEESAGGMLKEGLDAYEQGDFVKAIHVLIPQIERALRNLVALVGIPINKQVRRQPGIMQLKNINDILADDRIKHVLTENLWRYLQVFLADKRGLNLRNRVAHGLISIDECRRPVADQVFHAMLALSLIRKKTE